MLNFLEKSKEKILLFDGGMGSLIQKADLSSADYGGYPACGDYLSLSRPDVIAKIHADYLTAGADVVETNTFGANALVLSEYGLAEKTREINRAAGRLAKKEARRFSTPAKPRFAAGSIGPGSKLPSLGQIGFDELKESYRPQVEGLLEGEVDCFIVETSQDILQIKAAVRAICDVLGRRGEWKPIIAQVTIDQNGKTLTGSDMSAVLAALEPWPIDVIGLNCGLGPEAMMEAVQFLSRHSCKLISLMPNAGLPQIIEGKMRYCLSPAKFVSQMKEIAEKIGLNIAGGCCGTTPKHIQHLARALAPVKPRHPSLTRRPLIASLYQAQEIRTEPKPLIIGERANANGSKHFRELLSNHEFEKMTAMAVAQEQEGAHALDLSVAAADRDEKADMLTLTRLLNTRAQIPLMIDSTDPVVIEAALKTISGRPIINSINLEDGGGKARAVLKLCSRYGTAVVGLTIDEEGMAGTWQKKMEITRRLIGLVKSHDLTESDIFIDPLTFTLASGDENLKNSAKETLLAIREIKKRWPGSHILLGVSNISYGLPPVSRRYLNAVFLQRAVERGLDAAIFHAGKIISLDLIPPPVQRLCDSLIFNRRPDALTSFINYFSKHRPHEIEKVKADLPIQDKLRLAIIDGRSDELENHLNELMKAMAPLSIIQEILLPAMDEVGRLFRAGKKQLPFVLRSAEVMKTAMAFIQPHLPKSRKEKGILLLATVRGDIHDIGKNLVGIIFSANGFRVVDLGIRQTAENIVAGVKKYRPTAIGLSGLLVESVRAMKEYLPIFNYHHISLPVICGGAALTEKFVREEMKPIYEGEAFYAEDALAGLEIMKSFSLVNKKTEPQSIKEVTAAKPRAVIKKQKIRETKMEPNSSLPAIKIIRLTSPAELLPLLDREALFTRRWQWLTAREFKTHKKQEAERTLNRLWRECARKKLWDLKAVYGIFPARVASNKIHLPNTELLFSKKIASPFLRRLSISKAALQLVTVGSKIQKEKNSLAGKGLVEKQFLLHGLAAETCEALAEWCNQKIARENKWKKTRRFSPGYPIWPKLREQEKIFTLLRPRGIDVTLTENYQMKPEYSTSALVIPFE